MALSHSLFDKKEEEDGKKLEQIEEDPFNIEAEDSFSLVVSQVIQ